MANAADYLKLDTTQLLTTYKLRTRSIQSRTLVATNITPNYTLAASITSTVDAITVTPTSFTLAPNTSTTITVNYDTTQLELLTAGTLEGALNISVSATPIVVPAIPSPPVEPPLPEAPRQIFSRIQITPTNFTFSEVGETNQFTAILYVNDVAVPATFGWSTENDRADAFKIDTTSGVVKALKPGVNKCIIKAKVLTPPQYIGTEGLAVAASNISVISPIGSVEQAPTTGNLRIIVDGMSRSVGANITISGLNQTITDTTTFNNIPAGNYTITPNVVTVGNVNYNPTGGGEVYVSPGQNSEITIQYTKQSPPDINSIQITDVIDAAGNSLQQGQTVKTGDRVTVVASTYRNGSLAFIGTVQFNANNTQEGVITSALPEGRAKGVYRATFTITEPGTINISAFNQSAGSVSGQLNAIRRETYSIRITAPNTLLIGQCSPVTAVVLRDGIETTIPVQISVGGTSGRIGNDPCGVPQIRQQIVQRGGGGGVQPIVFDAFGATRQDNSTNLI